MKINSSILAAALGLASVSVATATTQYVYITGSTAARDAVYNTLIAGKGFDAVPTFVGYGSTTPGNCSYMIFSNTVSSTPTIVKCAWSGSEAGISDVSGSTAELFLSDPGTSGVATSGAFSTAVTGLTNDVHTVDIAQADNALAFSKNPSSTASSFSDSLVIPFVFVKNATTITDQGAFTNLTTDNFKNLANGGEKLAVYTGNAADVNNYVYLAGRDSNSGTRVNIFGVTGWGIKKNPFQIVLSGGLMTDPNGDSSYQTTGGQSSGGTLAKSLVDTTASVDQVNGPTGFIAVAYLGMADDATAEGAPFNAIRLSFNGVPYSVANVQNGLYTVWGYEYTLTRSGVGTVPAAFATALVNNIQNYTSGFEIANSTMNVVRSGPTAVPTHK